MDKFSVSIVLLAWPGMALAQEISHEKPSFDQESPSPEVEGYHDLGIDFSALQKDSAFTLHLGLDYSKGSYGDPEKTTMTYLPLSAVFEKAAWTVQASIGYIDLRGEDIIIPGTGVASFKTDYAREDSSRQESGFGDLYLSATYAITPLDPRDIFIDLTARVKLPTGSVDKGLSTGKADISLQVNLTKLMGNFAPFATLGYRYVGKSERFLLQDTWFASVGLIYYPSRRLSLGMSYDTRRSATIETENPREIMAFLDVQLSGNWAVNLYGLGGLSEGSPDFGTGLHLRYHY